MVLFLISMVVYLLFCIYGFKLYFLLQNKNKFDNKGVGDVLISYAIFFTFSFTLIPFAIFFPIWSVEYLGVIKHTTKTVYYFLFIGSVVLVFSIWLNRKSRPKNL